MRRFLRLPEVMKVTGKSRSSIYADKTFPKPIKNGARTSAWVSVEIEEWMEERLAARRS